jgi:hypothetical protein
MREWTLTLPNELPFWELKSWWTPKFSESNYKGQNPLDWGITYIIENLLERRCLKWARMTHLDNYNASYGQKKGQESNWQFDSRPLKIKNCPDFLAFRWRATYLGKFLMTLLQTSFQSKAYTQSYGAPKLWESQLWEFRNSHLWVLGQNAIWVLVSWPGTKYTIRGKVVASPKSGPRWVLWIRIALGSS